MSEVARLVSPTFEMVTDMLREYDEFTLPLHKAMFLRRAVRYAGNVIENGVLRTPRGIKFPVKSDEEIDRMKEECEGAKQDLMTSLGIDDEEVLSCLHTLVIGIRSSRAADPEARFRDRELSRGDWNGPHVGVFLNTVKTLAVLTGEAYPAWGNAYETIPVRIGPETDIDEIFEQSLAADIRTSSAIQENPLIPDDYKEKCSLGSLYAAYGIYPDEA